MNPTVKTILAAVVGGAASGGAAVAATTDPVVQLKAAAVGIILAASTLWVRKQDTIQARGITAVLLAIVGGAAQAIANGGASDLPTIGLLAAVGAITGAVAGQAIRSPNQE
jgi:hypothetical protein